MTGIAPLPDDDAQFGFTYPAAQFGHEGSSGQIFTQHSIAGGYVVSNGSPLNGKYLYGEFTRQGEIYHSSLSDLRSTVTIGPPAALGKASTKRARVMFDDDANPSTPVLEKTSMLDVINDSALYDGSGRSDIRFGQGPGGEIYITSKRNNTIYLVTSSVPGGPSGSDDGGDDGGDDGDGGDDMLPRILITSDKQGPDNYGWVEFADGTKQWVNATCRADLERSGLPVAIRDWPAIDAIGDRAPLPCADIADPADPGDDSDTSRPRILITADKQGAGNYGWVEFADNTKQWIDPSCRANLENAGLPVAILEWPAIETIDDRTPVPCVNIAIKPLPRILITADKQGSGNYGWVEFADNTKQWID